MNELEDTSNLRGKKRKELRKMKEHFLKALEILYVLSDMENRSLFESSVLLDNDFYEEIHEACEKAGLMFSDIAREKLTFNDLRDELEDREAIIAYEHDFILPLADNERELEERLIMSRSYKKEADEYANQLLELYMNSDEDNPNIRSDVEAYLWAKHKNLWEMASENSQIGIWREWEHKRNLDRYVYPSEELIKLGYRPDGSDSFVKHVESLVTFGHNQQLLVDTILDYVNRNIEEQVASIFIDIETRECGAGENECLTALRLLTYGEIPEEFPKSSPAAFVREAVMSVYGMTTEPTSDDYNKALVMLTNVDVYDPLEFDNSYSIRREVKYKGDMFQ